MTQEVTIEELKNRIGEETGVSDWLVIEQDRVNQFADVTLDHQFIHIDPDKAAKTPLGGTIAHGLLSLSLLPHFFEQSALVIKDMKMGLNYGFDKVRFLAPVHVGASVRGRAKLVDVQDKGQGRYLLTNELTVEIEGQDTPALVAQWLNMFIV